MSTLAATTNGLEGLAPWANLSVVGVLIVLVLWVMTRGFPNLLSRHDAMLQRKDAEVAAERQSFLNALEQERRHRDVVRHEHLKAIQTVAAADHEVHREVAEQLRLTRDVLVRVEEKIEV